MGDAGFSIPALLHHRYSRHSAPCPKFTLVGYGCDLSYDHRRRTNDHAHAHATRMKTRATCRILASDFICPGLPAHALTLRKQHCRLHKEIDNICVHLRWVLRWKPRWAAGLHY